MIITGAVLDATTTSRPFSDSRPLTITQLELEPPGPGEVVVGITAAGLCHSDLSVITGDRPRPTPMLLGHEASAVIVECGPGVLEFSSGQSVVMSFLPRCGTCSACLSPRGLPCVAGTLSNTAGTLLGGGRRISREGEPVNHHVGVSAFADYAVVNVASLVAIDHDVPPEVAAVMGCAVLTGGGAVLNVARPQPGESVAVVGLGGLGMAAVLTALAQDDVTVIGIDLSPERLERARDLGAHQTFTPNDALEKKVTAHYVIEAAGSARAFETAVSLTAVGGITIAVGLPNPTDLATLSPLGLVAEGRTIIGSYMGSSDPHRDIPVFLDLWREGKLPIESLITSRISLAQMNEGMDHLADAQGIRQVMIP